MADASHNMAKQAHQTGAAAGAGCVKPGALAWYADMPGLSSMSGPQVSLKKISRELGWLRVGPNRIDYLEPGTWLFLFRPCRSTPDLGIGLGAP